jgi:hypothetical protein
MPAVFYKSFWHILGDQVTKEVFNTLRGVQMPQGWNDTMVVLIPKSSNPQSMKDLRPISLCNIVYKAMFKKSFIVNFSVGLRFEINRLSVD